MNEKHQQTFLKLKPPCVRLSSIALKFRTRDASVKDVLRALEDVRDVVADLGKNNLLNAQLAEYAFFPLAQQVFNETKRLSPRCLEVAIECVTLLVSYGYRRALSLKLGRELLILMLMLAGSGSSDSVKPPDELKIAAFKCISEMIKALASASGGSTLFEDQGTKNVVDPLVYLLLESIVDGALEELQLSASEVLLQLIKAIKSRVFLASLLPRTVSSLIKALRPSTQVRRTKTVLTANLRVLRVIVDKTLADRIAVAVDETDEKEALGESWLKATSTQIKNALTQVAKLRNHESPVVHRALEELCVMIIEECRATLTGCVSAMLETLVMLSAKPDGANARISCRHLVVAYPENAEILRSSLANWSRSFPRIMQGHDEQSKVLALQRLAATSQILSSSESSSVTITDDLVSALVDGVSNALQNAKKGPVEVRSEDAPLMNVSGFDNERKRDFDSFLLDHQSQKDTARELRGILTTLKSDPDILHTTRLLVNNAIYSEGIPKLTSFWLALQLLEDSDVNAFTITDFLVTDATEVGSSSRSSLLSDLHVATLPLLSSPLDHRSGDTPSWELQALAMECTVMYACTFEGDAYRPELMDTLYPILSFLSSPNTVLRSHAMISLDRIAALCQYSSTTEMMIDNVDYLVNSVAWKLNTYSLSPEAPQILRMMVQLCGAELIPYLDDLIQSIFAALDNYHGYTEWVETLFQTLKAMVDVSIEKPQLMITEGSSQLVHKKATAIFSASSDILDDLRCRKRRRIEAARPAEEPPTKAPHRPWTDRLDGPSFPEPDATQEDPDEDDESNEHLSPMKPSEDEEKKLSKPHKLLLSIAQSTVPHLASPSPRVRHLLLDLLKDIAPLLGRDENSFLPLINAVWPVVIPRLFAEQVDDDLERNDEETAYNICAAADTVAMLCGNAGDFMSGRIDDIFHQLLRTFRKVRAQVKLSSQGGTSDAKYPKRPLLADQNSLHGSVNLQVVHQDTSSGAVTPGIRTDTQLRQFQQPARTSKGQILASLIDLLVAILNHVSLTLDRGDEIMQALLPMITHKESVRTALDVYNADAVWLWDRRLQSRSESDGLDSQRLNEPWSKHTPASAVIL